MAYKSVYPPEFSTTYVKQNTQWNPNHHYAHFGTDPALSLVGTYLDVSCIFTPNNSGKINIDYGSEKIVKRIYYENLHTSGNENYQGVRNFTFWGSNTAAAFADTAYNTHTNWTQITPAASAFDIHVAANQADPKYILVTNTVAYRYYAFEFADCWGGGSFMGFRRIELQITPVAGGGIGIGNPWIF